jgi:cation-transporting ATPase I
LEALGRVDTICFDKTGTVTEGTIVLGSVSDGSTTEPSGALTGSRLQVLSGALRASPVKAGDQEHADPLETALFREAETLGVTVRTSCPAWKRGAEVPFDASRGYSAVYGQADSVSTLSVKGTPEELLARSTRHLVTADDGTTTAQPLTASGLKKLTQQVHDLALAGLRVLGVAERSTESEAAPPSSRDPLSGLTFLGLIAFRDPVRKSAKQAIHDLRRAGLRPLIVTGDHPSTAEAIAVELKLSVAPQVLTGAELALLDEDELSRRVSSFDVFARVTPSQKVRVVRALAKSGCVVAMVGDGANDAPAIRLASVGVAMGQNAAEAARNAADIVLVDGRIETLVRAIVEGRVLWDAVRDAVSILVGGNLGEIAFTLFGGLVSGRPPLSPRQLLLVNLFTDVAPATALALRAPKEQDMDKLAALGPDASMGWRLDRDIGARALITASGASGAWIASSLVGDRRGASTTALLALVGTQLGQTLTSGEQSRQVVLTSLFTALGLAAIVQTPGVSGAFGCRPLGPLGWTIAIGSSTAATMAGKYVPDLLEDFVRQRSSAADRAPETAGAGPEIFLGSAEPRETEGWL